jgi:MFS family permease
MRLELYGRVLRLPGVRPLMVVALLVRVPTTAAGVALTLHVVLDLGRGYGAAGLVGAAATIGSAVGGPLLGRLVDRRGLRWMLVITTSCEALYWSVAPVLPYPALLVAAGLGGLLAIPAFSVIRQSIAALVPAEQRRQAYAIDSMSVEMSFMVGPTLAVLVVTQVSARAAMLSVGAATVLGGLALLALNPPVVTSEEVAEGSTVTRRRDWLTPRLIGILAVAAATTCVLGGTDVTLIAVLRGAGEVRFAGLVLALWGAYSMVGGFVYGAARRGLSPVALVIGLGLLTVPLGLVHNWLWLCLALVPAGALCAPTLAATADEVSRLAPASARGEAMGWQGAALTCGLAAGAPLAGAVIDAVGPSWGFAVVGAVGAAVGLGLLPAWSRRPARVVTDPAAIPGPVDVRD